MMEDWEKQWYSDDWESLWYSDNEGMDDLRKTGEQLKAEGIARALDNPLVQRYKKIFYATVEALPDGWEFTSEDIVEDVGLPMGMTAMHRNNAVGGCMSTLSNRKVMRKSGKWTKSRVPSSHATELPVWRRTVR